LDTNSLKVPPSKEWMTSKVMPKRCVKALTQSIRQLQTKVFVLDESRRKYLRDEESKKVKQATPVGDYLNPDADMEWKRKEVFLDMDIQEAFIRFMAGLLKGYNLYLKPVPSAPRAEAADPSALFESDGKNSSCFLYVSVIVSFSARLG
jgi:hypothetical protein